jgi:transposase-like protein
MEKKKYRIYTEEFRLEALELWKNSGKSAKKLERELGISAGMLSKWRQKYQVSNPGTSEASLEPSDLEAAKREIKHLQRQLAEVEEEREILKKTVNIFSRRNP